MELGLHLEGQEFFYVRTVEGKVFSMRNYTNNAEKVMKRKIIECPWGNEKNKSLLEKFYFAETVE